ncbi:hypothetical protein BRARA_F01944 [Brassica rapa]|uniref:Uncharacterized protein n=1 Tax=Brassica campestris TaxID=3711 RepID=A0A397YZK3_BRACM|nr:hypothetical protein BRARA_F01944 [Brassica rapa]
MGQFQIEVFFHQIPQISRFLTVGRPKVACIGCAGFATFSVLIEKFFDRHT